MDVKNRLGHENTAKSSPKRISITSTGRIHDFKRLVHTKLRSCLSELLDLRLLHELHIRPPPSPFLTLVTATALLLLALSMDIRGRSDPSTPSTTTVGTGTPLGLLSEAILIFVNCLLVQLDLGHRSIDKFISLSMSSQLQLQS